MFRSDDDPVAMPTARQGPDISVFQGIFGPKGDFDRLFPVYCRTVAGEAVICHMDDPEMDLRFHPSGGGLTTVTLGEPAISTLISGVDHSRSGLGKLHSIACGLTWVKDAERRE